VKARKVKGLDPAGSLHDNAKRIVATRLSELYSFDPHGEPQTLHNMRIAAKRLRYVLELTAPAFGEMATNGARQAKELQTLLGDLHDCDEMLALIDARRSELRVADTEAALALAPTGAGDLPATTARSLPGRLHYRGLETLAAYFSARRELLHRRFVGEWERLEREEFRGRLLDAL
jgi:CHAD domain